MNAHVANSLLLQAFRGPGQEVAGQPRAMPDVARGLPAGGGGVIDRVGMGGIEVPVRLEGDDGVMQLVPARAEAYVDLADPQAKGIHMSRLFLRLQEALEQAPLTPALLVHALEAMRASHADLSSEAHLSLDYEWLTKRPALVSSHAGWRSYPVRMLGSLGDEGVRLWLGITVVYSSTCPCSAALARQLIQESFDRTFAGRGAIPSAELRAWLGTPEAICATPHSQRSTAEVLVEVQHPDEAPSVAELINRVEEALQTVVQAAVKREDEQAFALVNGQNTMFCEDAARRIQAALELEPRVIDYRARCTHMESLHPHDAVSVVVKGLPRGLRPD